MIFSAYFFSFNLLTKICSQMCLLRDGKCTLARFRHQPLGLGEGGRAPLAHLLVV